MSDGQLFDATAYTQSTISTISTMLGVTMSNRTRVSLYAAAAMIMLAVTAIHAWNHNAVMMLVSYFVAGLWVANLSVRAGVCDDE